jgi:uncharacterized Tic20 family protein
MSTATLRRHSSHMVPHLNAEPRWQTVRLGLTLVLLGYLTLVVGAVVGGAFLWAANNPAELARYLPVGPEQKNTLTLFGVITLSLSVVVNIVLILIGEWLCMVNASHRQGARELGLVCLICTIVAFTLNVLTLFVGGTKNYEALQRGIDGVDRLEVLQGGGWVQLLGIALVLLNAFVFAQYMRAVAATFGDHGKSRSVDLHVGFASLMLGATIGVPLYIDPVSSRPDVLLGLGAGWLLCLFWHLLLIVGTRRCIALGLEALRRNEAPGRNGPVGQVVLASALRLRQ